MGPSPFAKSASSPTDVAQFFDPEFNRFGGAFFLRINPALRRLVVVSAFGLGEWTVWDQNVLGIGADNIGAAVQRQANMRRFKGLNLQQ